jgi:hypothetical protein
VGLQSFSAALDDACFAVIISDFSARSEVWQNTEKRLDRIRDELPVRFAGAKFVKETRIDIKGAIAAREFLFELERQRCFRIRLVCAPPRLFQLIVLGYAGFVASGDSQRFLESFVLSGAEGASPSIFKRC